MKCYYFGVAAAGEAGHHLYQSAGDRRVASVYRDQERQIPFALHILDTHLIPNSREDVVQVEGVVYKSVINGWTVLSFWDRSGDSRYSSNSAFVFDQEVSTSIGLALAKEQFPVVFKRFKFEFRAAKGD